MSLQWYPGHMTKARRELAAKMASQDVMLEVLDARLPLTSHNPVIAEARGNVPVVRILTRADLADPDVTVAWLRYFNAQPGSVAFASTMPTGSKGAHANQASKHVADACKQLGLKHTRERPLHAVIAGIPNVGKSTLINMLAGRTVAIVGDKPAVTKVQQHVITENGMILTDTPGLMWPKIEDETAAFRIALVGSIPDTAIDYATLANFGATLMLERYPQALVTRFKLASVPPTAHDLLVEIGKRRGCLKPGGGVDLHKAAEILVREVRSGGLGRISLEVPPPTPSPTSPASAPPSTP
jgi:ribosome biogenesis GTPase A